MVLTAFQQWQVCAHKASMAWGLAGPEGFSNTVSARMRADSCMQVVLLCTGLSLVAAGHSLVICLVTS